MHTNIHVVVALTANAFAPDTDVVNFWKWVCHGHLTSTAYTPLNVVIKYIVTCIRPSIKHVHNTPLQSA